MSCFVCSMSAVAVCTNCGVALCREHLAERQKYRGVGGTEPVNDNGTLYGIN